MQEKTQYTQQQIQSLFLPIIKDQGQLYHKSKNVFARRGVKGEKIPTITSDGKETENIVRDNTSFVVKNQTKPKEKYIVLEGIFHKRYTWLKSSKDGFAEYQPKGKVIAIKLTRKIWKTLNLPEKEFHYEPPWKGSARAKLFDYMVCFPDYSEVYRIARKEFWETYKKT